MAIRIENLFFLNQFLIVRNKQFPGDRGGIAIHLDKAGDPGPAFLWIIYQDATGGGNERLITVDIF